LTQVFTNFAPRIGFALSPTRDSKFVIRSGGFFYSTTFQSLARSAFQFILQQRPVQFAPPRAQRAGDEWNLYLHAFARYDLLRFSYTSLLQPLQFGFV
jgi:hypothetical protein